MLNLRFAQWPLLLSMVFLGGAANVARGQDYPSKPVRIVTTPVGGGLDFVARLMAQGLTAPLGQPVIVDNRGGGVVTAEVVAKAPPDGYTLLIGGSAYIIAPFLQATPYDPVMDFSPISMVGISPAIVVVHPSLPVKSIKDLVALAKARPRQLNYSSSVLGGSAHLAAELFNSMADIKIVQIVYKGVGPALTGIINGEVHVTFATTESALPQMKSGRLRGLAVTSAQPSALAPGLPTVAAAGLPGYEAIALYAMSAPARTPAAIVNRLSQETKSVLAKADVKQKLLYSGIEAVGGSPQELADMTKSEMARWGKLIKDIGLRTQ